MRLGWLAVDQHGETHRLTEPKNPLNQLLAAVDRKSAQKMYVDPNARHVGWIIGRQWFEVFEVHDLHASDAQKGGE